MSDEGPTDAELLHDVLLRAERVLMRRIQAENHCPLTGRSCIEGEDCSCVIEMLEEIDDA